MSVEEIEKAIKELPADDLSELAGWFSEFEAGAWDQQIKDDLASGKLQKFLDEAAADLVGGDV